MAEHYAARFEDKIIHTSLLADIASIAFEGIVYTAAGAIVAGTAMLAAPVLATAGLAGAAAAATALGGSCVASGFVAGLLLNIGGLTDKISEGCSGLANMLFPPSPAGKINSGSNNVFINNLAAARAAGRLLTATEIAQLPPEQEQTPGSVRDYASMLLNVGKGILSQLWCPTVDGPSGPTAEAEVDKVFCTKHTSQQYMAEGSSKVTINDLPAVRADDRTTCEAKVTKNVSPNVIIGGESVVVRPISSGKLPGLELAFIAAALLTGKTSKIMKTLPCMFAMAGAGMLVNKLGEAINATLFPVHAATGAKVLGGEEDLDFALPARYPLVWQRIYNSRNQQEGLFGRGWRTEFETWVKCADEEYCYYDLSGRELRLPRQPEGIQSFSAGEGILWISGEEGQLVIADTDGSLWRLYLPHPTKPQHLRLASLSDEYGNGLLLHYDAQDRLSGITDTQASLKVELHYQLTAFPHRITEIVELLKSGENRLLMSYAYDQNGDLTEVRDATDVITRAFGYTQERLLTWHRLPSGLRCDYRWQKLDDWRVTEQRTSTGGHYRLTYDLAQRLTTVTDEAGLERKHWWNAAFLPERYTDEAGNDWHYRWDENDLLQESSDPQGYSWLYRYDEAGNLMEEEDPSGKVRLTQWLPERSLPVCVTEPDGSRHHWQYDQCHGLICEVDALGRMQRYERDEFGQVISHTNAADGVSRFSWNAYGQITESRDCSGQLTRYGYNEAHLLSEITDATGESLSYSYDAAGRPTGSGAAESWRNRLRWSKTGQLSALVAADGTQTHYVTDHAGRLTLTRNPRGGEVCREYDVRGRLTRLTNENQESYRFIWGANDRLMEEHGLDGVVTRYSYDACDRLTGKTFAAGTPQALHHRMEYDATGQLLCHGTLDGETRYGYSATGQLTSAIFTPRDEKEQTQTLAFRYDAAGQLLAENSNGSEVRYQYDVQGNRTSVTLPDGRSLKTLYYGSGHALQIMLDELTITEFTRDSLHREVQRTQGALTSHLAYDRLGRISRRSLCAAPYPARPLAEQSRDYDLRHNLVHEQQTVMPYGWRRYDYDERDQLRGRASDYVSPETWFHDPAANLMDRDTLQSHWRHNRLLRFQGVSCDYDIYGRTTEKRRDGERWTYSWDSRHQLKEVVHWPVDSYQPVRCTRFTYDPLGRRTVKESWRETRRHRRSLDEPIADTTPVRTTFIWEGYRLLAEERGGLPMVYLYEDPQSYVPLARADGRDDKTRVYYCHCQQNGLTERMTDEKGEEVWWGNFSSFGKANQEGGPLRREGQEQNLRFQGQYLDRETGLHYNLFRYYDPDIGRFTQYDPIGLAGGLNLYQYAVNPLGWVDPLGLSCGPTKKGRIKEAQLPIKGRIRYVPPKDWRSTMPLPKKDSGYLDRFGNVWTRGPSRTAGQPFEWDVQLSGTGRQQIGWVTRDGSHANISLDGRVTHK